MYLLLVLILTIACTNNINAINVTYPIKGAYIGWEAGLQIANNIKAPLDNGYNYLVLSLHTLIASEMVQNWNGLGTTQSTLLNIAHSKGAVIVMGILVDSNDFSNLTQYNATELGGWIGDWVSYSKLDGADLRINTYRAFDNFRLSDTLQADDSVKWVVDLVTATRAALGEDKVLTISTPAYNFGEIGEFKNARVGPSGGFTAVHPQIADKIQHYHLHFFNGGPMCYVDYDGLFVQAGAQCNPRTSIQEISVMAGIDSLKLVVCKPIQSYNVGPQGSGYLDPNVLGTYYSTAKSTLSWDAGVIGWTWNDTTSLSSKWVQTVFNPTAIPVTTTGIPSITTTAEGTTNNPTSTTNSNTGGQPTKLPILPDCTEFGKSRNSDGICVCRSGFFKSGEACKPTYILIMAIIIPIVVIPIIVIAIIVLIRRKRNTGGGGGAALTRVYSKSISAITIPELESNYNNSNLITDYGAISIKKRLGQGGSGVVNLGVWCHIEVAVKEFTNQDIQTTDFIRESEIHAKLRHPNVVQLLAICLPPHMCTISEFMAKGSLADVLQEKNASFTWKRKLQSLHDIAKGMDYLQKSKIVHRDLKSQNCLIDKNWTTKIADFGTSKLVGEANATATAYVPRTAQWSAPEVITKGEYSEKSDVYSFGVIMWECFTGEVPYDGMFAFQVEDRTVKGSRLTIPVGCEAWYEALMQECWHAEIDQRPNFEIIIGSVDKALSAVRDKK